MCVSGMTCGGERTNESDEQHVYLQQICGACISRKLMTCIQSAPFRHVVARRGRKATARQNAGGVAPGSPNFGLGSDLAGRRTLRDCSRTDCAFP